MKLLFRRLPLVQISTAVFASLCERGGPQMKPMEFPRIYLPTDAPPQGQRDVVVLLHGLFATTRSMQKASACASDSGFDVINWGYPTFWKSIEAHCEQLSEVVAQLQSDAAVRSVNFLTHSLGGILARYVIENGSDAKIHRMVMLAPPNSGSHLTRVSLGPFKRFLPAISQLSESADGLPNRIHNIRGVEVGVIAAAQDFIVRVQNTLLADQREHRVVDATHFALPKKAQVLELALRFLQTGTFGEPAALARLAA